MDSGYEISIKDDTKCVGMGRFSKVFPAELWLRGNKDARQWAAVKMFVPPRKGAPTNSKDDRIHLDTLEGLKALPAHERRTVVKSLFRIANKEVAVLECLDHPHLPKLLTCATIGQVLPCLVTPMYNMPTLNHVLQSEEAYTMVDVNRNLQCILSAIKYLVYQHSVVHLDLKTDNVLIESMQNGKTLKIIDFNCCADVGEVYHLDADSDKCFWIPPECCLRRDCEIPEETPVTIQSATYAMSTLTYAMCVENDFPQWDQCSAMPPAIRPLYDHTSAPLPNERWDVRTCELFFESLNKQLDITGC